MILNMPTAFLLIISVFSSLSSAIIDVDPLSECGIYLAPSLTAALGRGLIAGKDIVGGQMINPSVTLAVRYDDIKSTQLMNYLFGSHEDDVAIAELGFDMMLNHREMNSIERNWETPELNNYSDQKLAHTTYTNVVPSMVSNVSGRNYHNDPASTLANPFSVIFYFIAGEELFCSYGDAHWFESRDFSPSEDIQDVRQSL
jgi:hypothetical protein